VQKRLTERGDVPGRYSGVTVLSSKLECGVCGSMYTPRPWHSTSYNNLVWQCRNRTKKGPKCPTLNVYDRLLHFVIHDAARDAAFKRGVTQTVADIVIAIVGKERADDVRQWVRAFQKKNAWRMLSDEDDLALVLRRITVMPDRKLRMLWLDGKQTKCLLPKYYPTKGIEDYDDK